MKKFLVIYEDKNNQPRSWMIRGEQKDNIIKAAKEVLAGSKILNIIEQES